ncbi:hypothetical protein V6N12_066479 [Hibiscus sabdariffa]|uniref:Reverse transcriptase zinc-binding domain-containing protein n=1 Tax=Hibiscus sabdariffa TaxID=183260 RepID=A0ABR2CQ88_9ROSI
MIFCEASLDQVRNVKRVLRIFELASGLQLNLKKCKIFDLNVSDDLLVDWADKELIANKYSYELDRLLPSLNHRGRCSWIWVNILKSYEKEDHFGVCLKSNLRIQVGDGKSIWFWLEIWICNEPLSTKFPRIFAICISKLGVIADFGYKSFGICSWDIPLRRSLFDWEVEQWNSLLALLNEFCTSNFDKDWVSWKGLGDGKFTAKAIVKMVNNNVQSIIDWNLLVWSGLAPPKVEVFMWKCYEHIKANFFFLHLVPRSCNLEADALAKVGIG